MRWTIIRTIWFREMRDQLRDRRTLFVILGLPLILYPLLGFAVLRVAVDMTEKPSVVGVVTGARDNKDFPARRPAQAGRHVAPVIAWFSATPIQGSGIAEGPGVWAFARASQMHLEYPLLIEGGQFALVRSKTQADAKDRLPQSAIQFEFLEKYDPNWEQDRKLDLVLSASDSFFLGLEQGENVGVPKQRPGIQLHARGGDERSRRAQQRLTPFLNDWNLDLKKVRLARKGYTEQFMEPFEVTVPPEPPGGAGKENLLNLMVRFFPLLLVMWSLSGALYPAIDLCAGEKERGTMETLLITPAGREEIVLGKFLTIWVFSAGTALTNLLSMGITTTQFAAQMPHGGISLGALCWCVVLSLPQSAFFSALSLAIGAYARSSKEGQYYLMPLFVVTMPLICLTLVPGVELNPFYSMVPVTGVALLMQRLMLATSLSEVPWGYFGPVLLPIGLYSWLALRWAIEQFNREDVLFREAERLDLLLWVKRLFREKEPMPTAGEAFFCLGLLIGLRWLSLGMGARWPLEMHTAITQLAFVAMPPLLMILLLNTQPGEALYLRWPRGRDAGLALLLAMLLLPPLAGLTQAVGLWFPRLLETSPGATPQDHESAHPLIAILRSIRIGEEFDGASLLRYFLAFAVMPAICEELAFRGFVLRGLHHGFRPRNAVLLSSLFFALFHLNVFLFLPTFVLGVVLGLLTVRSRSLLPAILFHLLHNSLLIALIPLSQYTEGVPHLLHQAWPWLIGVCAFAGATLIWWLYRKPYADLEREAASRAP